MPDLEFQVLPREVLGKKVRALRRQGVTPANIYGRGVESRAVQAETSTVIHLLRTAGRNAGEAEYMVTMTARLGRVI